jgi:hypothetical protein
MSVTISAAQRDALHDQIFDRLSGIGDIWVAASAERYEDAGRLACEYSDELGLILDDLGWGAGPGETIELKTSPEVLRRVLPRLERAAAKHSASLRAEREEVEAIDERSRLVGEVCRSVLADLDGAGA